jgi:oligosaccharyl transferase (archaeosortase A-associated)
MTQRLWLAAILALALGLRIYGPWAEVFQPTHVNLLDNDAWYHLRAIENAATQFPHRLTIDPYASPNGQYIAVAPLFDLLVASVAWVNGLVAGGTPAPPRIATIAAFAAPLLGTIAIIFVFAVARVRAGPLAGLLAATLAAILPGHFLDRTLLGFIDHHALEALLSMAMLFVLVRSVDSGVSWYRPGLALGLLLGAYLLTWTSAAFLVTIIAAWLGLHGAVCIWRGEDPGDAARVVGLAAVIAVAIDVAFQSSAIGRYATQLVSLGLLLAVAVSVEGSRRWLAPRTESTRRLAITAAAIAGVAIAAAALTLTKPGQDIVVDLLRFTPGPQRMQVIEARPLFLFDGTLSWQPAWRLFRSGFVVGLIGLAAVAALWIRNRRPVDLLLLVWGTAMYLATIGQNRFGYYLVPIAAILGGCVCAWTIEAGRRAQGWRRDAAVIAVAAVAFGPNLVPAMWTTGRPASLPASWLPAFEWLRERTPEPFGDARYYDARYDRTSYRRADYTVMAWWDYGYWITQVARRVPVANPTQGRASEAASFFIETDHTAARKWIDKQRARYVLVDDLLPFRAGDAALIGRFEAVAVWAGRNPSSYFEVFLERANGGYRPVVLYFPEYFQTMAFRLAVLGGNASRSQAASVVSWTTRSVPGQQGGRKVITDLRDFPSTAAALAYLATLGAGEHRLVSRSPLQPPIDTEVIPWSRVFRTPAGGSFGAGAVQIFEVPSPGLP